MLHFVIYVYLYDSSRPQYFEVKGSVYMSLCVLTFIALVTCMYSSSTGYIHNLLTHSQVSIEFLYEVVPVLDQKMVIK